MDQQIVKQYTTPLPQPIDSDKSIFELVKGRAERLPDKPLICYKEGGKWIGFNGIQFRDMVIRLAKGFLGKGIQKGDAVAIFSHTSWEWVALDASLLAIGAVVVPVYETNSSAQVKQIFNDSSVAYAFAENIDLRSKIESVKTEIPSLKEAFTIGEGALDAIEAFGKNITDEEFEKAAAQVKGDDVATIVYTSGSTGTPKGAELTHSNFVFAALSGCQYIPRACNIPDRRILMFLPLSHVFARYMEMLAFAGTLQMGLTSNFTTIIQDFQSFGPTLLLAVPRIFEKVYNAASQKAGTGYAGHVFARAAKLARLWSEREQEGKSLGVGEKMRYSLYKKLVYSKILEVFGPNADFCITGGAPIDPSLAHFFAGIGMPLLNGYGMTETCGPVTVETPTNKRIGTVGAPLCGMTVGIAEDGEICIKSRSVMKRYHNMPEATQEALVDGWFHTGDVGDIDDAGRVLVTDRKKELIITAGGINVAPAPLQASIECCPVVAQCLVIGNNKRFVSALITLDLEDTNQWLQSKGLQPCKDLKEASENPVVRSEVQSAVDAANKTVSRAESIRKFAILPGEFTPENGMLTVSLKVRRKQVEAHYKDVIESIYKAPAPKKQN
ncbi:MAG: long-chain fatty acid--CoA ligase [Aeriscardovia sp.]|nr:long-chain fatty acid--CoA ligase [Aeriscardovia sp.]